jgi:Domain of unknown function (DUF4249)
VKQQIINTILLISYLLIWSACEETVELGGEFEEKLAVVCQFAPGEPFKVYVSKTKDPLSVDATVNINNAEVLLYQGEVLQCTLSFIEEPNVYPPYYFNENCMPEAGVAYTLRVKVPGFDEIVATDLTPPNPAVIDSFKLSNLEVQYVSGDTIARFLFDVSILLGETETNPSYYVLNMNYEEVPYQIIGSDTIIDRTGEFTPLSLESLPGNPVLTKHFDEQMGAVLFTRQSAAPLSLRFKVTTPRLFDLTEDLFDRVYGNLRTVSKDYYDYHLHLSRQQLQQDSFFLTPVILFNNIENGYGIFAGYQLTRDSLTIDYQ